MKKRDKCLKGPIDGGTNYHVIVIYSELKDEHVYSELKDEYVLYSLLNESFYRDNSTDVSEGHLPLSPDEDSLKELVLYVVVAILLTIIIALLLSVGVLLAQLKHLRNQMQHRMEQAMTIRKRRGDGDSTFKALDGTDYWFNFRCYFLMAERSWTLGVVSLLQKI